MSVSNMTHPDILQAEATGFTGPLHDFCEKIKRMADRDDEPTDEDIRSDQNTSDRQEKGMFNE